MHAKKNQCMKEAATERALYCCLFIYIPINQNNECELIKSCKQLQVVALIYFHFILFSILYESYFVSWTSIAS